MDKRKFNAAEITEKELTAMKAVLISIKPKWCELIASGKKTVEVRKTKPKLEKPFKCYIYCTKPKKILKYGFHEDDYPEEMRPCKTVFCKVPDGSSPFCSEVNCGEVIPEGRQVSCECIKLKLKDWRK